MLYNMAHPKAVTTIASKRMVRWQCTLICVTAEPHNEGLDAAEPSAIRQKGKYAVCGLREVLSKYQRLCGCSASER